MENLMKKINKGGFSFLEVCVTALLVMIVVQISTSLYRNYQENSDLQLAKTKISKLFYLYSMKSFYQRKEYYFTISNVEKTIEIKNSLFLLENKVVLPNHLSYYLTSESVQDQKYGHLTKNGNIRPSFSIYLFGYQGFVREKITFSSFQETKILRLRQYRKIRGKEIDMHHIQKYHLETNKNRELFYKEWREE